MASKTPSESVEIIHSMVHTGKFDVAVIDRILARPVSPLHYPTVILFNIMQGVAPGNATDLLARRAAALASPPNYGTADAMCAAVHPHTYACRYTFLPTFLEVAQWMLPVYGTLTFVPMFLFRRGAVARRPMEMISKAALSTLRSSAFLGVFVIIFRSEFFHE